MFNLAKPLKTMPLLLSLFMGAFFIFLSEHGPELKHESFQKTQNIEHSILLDLTAKTDKVIYDNLIYSSYFCNKINPRQAQCRQFKANEPLRSQAKETELYSYTSNTGQALRVYQTKNGVAHLELKDNKDSTLHRYSFTSVDKVFSFTNEHKQIFKTEKSEWDVSTLNSIL